MSQDSPLDPCKEFFLRLPSPLTVFANSEQIARLTDAAGAEWLDHTILSAIDLSAPLPTDDLLRGQIVVLQVDANAPASLERVKQLRASHPDIVQIAALANADARLVRTLLREGVADVVDLPLDPEEILQAGLAAMEDKAQSENTRTRRAPLIAVTRAEGGGGATTIATHLAHRLASDNGSCCLFDLDIQFGRVSEVLGLHPRRTLSDLLEAGERLDEAFLRSVCTEMDDALSIVAAPQDIAPLESLDSAHLLDALGCAMMSFDHVLLDMPSNLTNWALSLLARSDAVILLCDQTVSSLRQARRRIDLFRSVGIDPSAILVVVNRVERKMFSTIGIADVERALSQSVFAKVALDNASVSAAQDQGILVDRIKPKSAFNSDIAQLAEQLCVRLEASRAP